jgi:DNA-binding MarR family transcriptional regulator
MARRPALAHLHVTERVPPPVARAGGLRLERFAPYRLVVAATLASRALARIYGEHFGVGIPEWRVMALLGQFDRLTARDVGELSQMHKTKVSRAVSELSERGLVERTPNREDRREAFLSLTAPGRRIYEQIAPMALSFEARLMEDVPPEDLAAFDRVLSMLSERARVMAGGVSDDAD